MTPITISHLSKVRKGGGVRCGAFVYANDPQGSLFDRMNGHALRVAGLGITVDTGGLIAELRDTAAMRRTADIRQFDFKRDPLPNALGLGGAGKPFNHTRFNHMIGTGAISQLMVHNNRDSIPSVDHDSLVAFDATHDVSSMAGNDGVKLVRPGRFEEDLYYRDSFLCDPGIAKILERHHANPELMAQLSSESDPRYKVFHDIADRVSYVSGDIEEFERLTVPHERFVELATQNPVRRIYELSRNYRGRPIGSLWETVRFDDQGPYFLDGDHLARFLELRANLFAGIYLNPQSRGADCIVAIILVRYCFEKGLMSFTDLLKMDDSGLLRYLGAISGFNRFVAEENGIMPNPERIFLATPETALRESARLAAAGNLTLIEDCSHSPGTAVGWRIKSKGRIRPLKDMLPTDAERIEKAMALTRRITVSWIPAGDLVASHGIPEQFAQKLLAFEQERLRII